MLENSVMATAAMRRALTAILSSVLGASDTDRFFSAVLTGASSDCESFGDGSDEVSDGMETSPSSVGVRRAPVLLGAGEACFKNACGARRKGDVSALPDFDAKYHSFHLPHTRLWAASII